MEVILYSTGCPKCRVLKKTLELKGIAFQENNSVDEMLELGIDTVPMAVIDGKLMNYKEVMGWISQNTKE